MMTVSGDFNRFRLLICFSLYSIAVTVGFIRTQVNVSESATREDVCFRVLAGTLDRSIVVTVTTEDGSANCE